tara:strand:+ start:576 stop:1649 length:1074 start_codon:yes stop_codon:yes gene_type:complete
MSKINLIELGTDENGQPTVNYPLGKPNQLLAVNSPSSTESRLEENVESTETTMYAGVFGEWEKVAKVMISEADNDHSNAFNFINALLTEFPSLPTFDNAPLAALKLFLREHMQPNVNYTREVLDYLTSQETWVNSHHSFYADQTMHIEGIDAWPIVAANEEGFHRCIGIVIQDQFDSYIAMPFLHDIPFDSPLEFINLVKNGAYDNNMQDNTTIEMSLQSFSDHIKDTSTGTFHIISLIQDIVIHRYLLKIKFYDNVGRLEVDKEDADDTPTLRVSDYFITEIDDSKVKTHFEIFNQIKARTIDIEEDKIIDPYEHPIKRYKSFGYAMNDLISINQIGMKQQQETETKSFFKDFLSL